MKKVLASLCLISMVFGIISCVPNSQSATPVPTLAESTKTPIVEIVTERPEGKFLFVEIWREIEGTGKVPGGPRIDRPTYSFDLQSKVLNIGSNKIETLINASDWGFAGEGTSILGTAGGGTASVAILIEQIPYNTTLVVATGKVTEMENPEFETLSVMLNSVLVDGTIFLQVGEQTIVLKTDEAWVVTKQINFSSERYNGQLTVTSSITNHGWLSINL